jgi:phosphoserine phosphatase RsbU/P
MQGALIAASDRPEALGHQLDRLNRFLYDRTGGEKYATVFFCLLDINGRISYVNAAHCPPIVVRTTGELQTLPATSVPVGMLEVAEFPVADQLLAPGDKVVIYSDGVTEAQNRQSEFFEKRRLREIVAAHAADSCPAIHDAIQEGVAAFTEGAPQADDITVLVLEFRAATA